MNTYILNTLSLSDRIQLLKRPKMDFSSIFEVVHPIIDHVAMHGDVAVLSYTNKFDGISLNQTTVTPSEYKIKLHNDLKHAIDVAFRNIETFHRAQIKQDIVVETMPGVICRKIIRPIERVGVYIPGGTAILPSTAMMLCIPAMIAGCSTIVLSTPPNAVGRVPDEVVYIAQKAGVNTILLAGGAQAVAAMAYGTASIPKVDKILGPGNQFVTAAKMILQNSEAQISIDMPAGPSEVLVIADAQANPKYVAADLLSQAEHGSDSQVVLVALKGFDLSVLETELKAQLTALPRKEFAQKALEHSFIVKANTLIDAIDFSNDYAPEHLIINIDDAESITGKIKHAGSVFIGSFTPESVGDYASGTNHTLPTYGYARMYSGVNVSSFQKSITMQTLTKEGLKLLGPIVEELATAEGLQAHKNAVSIRLKDLENE